MHPFSKDPHQVSTSLKKKGSSKADIDTEESLSASKLELTDKLECCEAGLFSHLDPIKPSLYVNETGFTSSII